MMATCSGSAQISDLASTRSSKRKSKQKNDAIIESEKTCAPDAKLIVSRLNLKPDEKHINASYEPERGMRTSYIKTPTSPSFKTHLFALSEEKNSDSMSTGASVLSSEIQPMSTVPLEQISDSMSVGKSILEINSVSRDEPIVQSAEYLVKR